MRKYFVNWESSNIWEVSIKVGSVSTILSVAKVHDLTNTSRSGSIKWEDLQSLTETPIRKIHTNPDKHKDIFILTDWHIVQNAYYARFYAPNRLVWETSAKMIEITPGLLKTLTRICTSENESRLKESFKQFKRKETNIKGGAGTSIGGKFIAWRSRVL